MLASFQQVNTSGFEMLRLGSINPSQVEHNYLCLVVACTHSYFFKKPSGQIWIVGEVPLICSKNKFQSRHWDLILRCIHRGFLSSAVITYTFDVNSYLCQGAQKGNSLVGKTALHFLVAWSEVSTGANCLIVFILFMGKGSLCFGQFLKAVSFWSVRKALTEAADVRSIWLVHLEQDTAGQEKIFLHLVFVSWENGKNTIFWDIFSHLNYCSKCLRLLLWGISVLYFQLNTD